ncbi:MAG TPA: hypothetical protein VH482_01885 [Thermomicrobiales bacterium]|jgi:uncharacterized cupredoxin-like copper-binding protein
MSRRPSQPGVHDGVSATRWLAVACAVLALLAGGFVQGAAVRAQDASPVPSPVAAECDAPTLPPGTPTPQMQGSPVAAPAGAEEEAAATPEAGTPADEATAAAITAAVENYAACYNTGDPTKYDALKTENQLLAEYGSTNPYDAIASDQGSPPFAAQIVSITNPMTYADGRVSAEIEVILGGHQFQHETMFFVQDGEYWKLDEEVILAPEPEGDTAVVGVQLATPDNEYTIVPAATEVTQSPVLIFHVTNAGKEAHEMLVLLLPEGADPMGLINGSLGFDQVQFLGGVFGLAPGDAEDLALVNLDPGTYTLICFFPAPDGKSHAEHGMVTQFKIDPPA